jgi:bacteriorhodopsin
MSFVLGQANQQSLHSTLVATANAINADPANVNLSNVNSTITENKNTLSNSTQNQADIGVGLGSMNSLKFSFLATYALFWTTGAITFIEALRTNNSQIRHVMNIETVISIVAAFFYYQFVQEVKTAQEQGRPVNYKAMNETRYTDWFITTPLMLFSVAMTMEYNRGGQLKALPFLGLIVANYAMMGLGYAGEINKIDHKVAMGTSFMFFFFMFAWLYWRFTKGGPTINYIIFFIFFIVWSIYGVAYDLKEETKNIVFNVLDAFSKCIVGIFFWILLTKSIVL